MKVKTVMIAVCLLLCFLLLGCASLRYPECPKPKDANDICALDGDLGQVFGNCRCPDKHYDYPWYDDGVSH